MYAKIGVEKTKKGRYSIWEKGGGDDDSNGYANIIADRQGNPKRCVFVNKNKVPNGEHALFILEEGDLIITNVFEDGMDNIIIFKVEDFIDDTEPKADCKIIAAYNKNRWSALCNEMEDVKNINIDSIIQAVVDKARTIDATEMYYGERR